MRLFYRVGLAGVLGLATLASPAYATSIIANGDFSSGNTGFGSAYSYDQTNCWAAGSIAVVTSPLDCHPLWASFGDHTTGTGQMMVINGSMTAGTVVWSDDVSVAANTNYFFSAWIASNYALNPAQLIFSINGIALGPMFPASSITGTWQQFFVPWNSGGSSSASIALVNQNLEYGGNDFALDDLSLTTSGPPLTANPEPASVILLATGLLGAGARLRKRRGSPRL
jgi:hypothetical protein